MYSAIRTIAVVLFLSLLLGVALAVLLRGGIGQTPPGLLAGALVMFLFTIPVLSVYLWENARRRSLDRASEHARHLASGRYDPPSHRSAFQDIAALDRAIEELRQTILRQNDLHRQTVELWREIVNGMGEGLLAIDRDRQVALANRRFGELFGVAPLVGRPLIEVVRHAPLLQAFDEALAGKATVTRTSFAVGAETRQLEMRIFPLISPEVAAVALLIDVSRLARLENVRRDFLADFSHEVRTPLAGIRAAVETLETRPVTPEQDQQLRKIISRQLNRLERLLDDMKQLSAIEAGEVVLHPESVDLRDLLAELGGDFSERFSDAGMKLTIEGEPSIAHLDPARAHQIFANLVDNAVKHARGATEVRIEIEDSMEQAVVRVIDNGAGIPVEDQERIFNRFFRGDPSRSQSRPGTGLGLAIVKHLVLLHGGSIAVRSSPGHGAVFEVRLPKSSQHSAVSSQ